MNSTSQFIAPVSAFQGGSDVTGPAYSGRNVNNGNMYFNNMGNYQPAYSSHVEKNFSPNMYDGSNLGGNHHHTMSNGNGLTRLANQSNMHGDFMNPSSGRGARGADGVPISGGGRGGSAMIFNDNNNNNNFGGHSRSGYDSFQGGAGHSNFSHYTAGGSNGNINNNINSNGTNYGYHQSRTYDEDPSAADNYLPRDATDSGFNVDEDSQGIDYSNGFEGGGDVESTPHSHSGFVYMVHFKRSHRYFLIHPDLESSVSCGSFVVVEADRGEDLGIVGDLVPAERFWAIRFAAISKKMLKNILRVASHEEVKSLVTKTDDEIIVTQICQEILLTTHPLPIDIVDAEYQFDRNKLTIYHDSRKRNDFRSYVRDLFCVFKTRIWMQQVDAKSESLSVSTRMALDTFNALKYQNNSYIATSVTQPASMLSGASSAPPAPHSSIFGYHGSSPQLSYNTVGSDGVNNNGVKTISRSSSRDALSSSTHSDISSTTSFMKDNNQRFMPLSGSGTPSSVSVPNDTDSGARYPMSKDKASTGVDVAARFESTTSSGTSGTSPQVVETHLLQQMKEIYEQRELLRKEKEEVAAAHAALLEERARLEDLKKSMSLNSERALSIPKEV